MTHHAVSLKVTPCLRIECKFWLEDEGWNGTSDSPHAKDEGQSCCWLTLIGGVLMYSRMRNWQALPETHIGGDLKVIGSPEACPAVARSLTLD